MAKTEIDYIMLGGKNYPMRYANIDIGRVKIGTKELEDTLFVDEDHTTYVNDDCKDIDEDFFGFIPNSAMLLPEKEFYEFIEKTFTVERNTRVTTREEMMNLKKGDKFYVNGEEHIASTDSHYSGDGSYDGNIVYDEEGESWFQEDFPEKN